MLFIQVRSVAAESDRAFQGGPFERTYYQEASLFPGGRADTDSVNYEFPSRYSNKLDWFAVDLEGEHSAMDGRILEEHTDYVVYAIHRVFFVHIFHQKVFSRITEHTALNLVS